MKSLLCAGILLSSLCLAINFFGHTSAGRIPYNSTGDDADDDDYAPPQKRIYGTVFNKKCNCTKVVKQALANAYGNEEDEGEEKSYSAPKYAKKKPMRAPQYEEEEEEYSEPKPYKSQKPKKMSKPLNSSYSQQDEYQEEEEEETYSKPKSKPSGYGKKPKPRPVKVVKVKVEESYDEEENEYDIKPSYGKKNSTSYKKPKQRADYADSVSMDELLGEENDEEYQPKKKPSYAKPKPQYAKPKYEEAQEEEEDDGYDMRDEMTYKKPQRKSTKRVKPAAYEEEAEDQYEEPAYKPAPKRRPAYAKPEIKDYEDSSYGQKEEYARKTNYSAPKQKEPEYAAPSKPSGSQQASKPEEKASASEYGTEKKHSHKPAESEYAESRPDYDIKPVNSSYGKEEKKHHHTTPKHHETTKHHAPAYSEPEAPKYEEKKEGGYETSGQNAVIPPKVITVHQNASRETGILIKLVDHKKAPAAEYQAK